VVFVPGNHEGVELFEFLDTWQSCNRNPLVLARESFVLGPLVIVGFPCGMGDSTDLLRLPPLRLDRWLPSLVHARGPAARTLWLMHEPPTDTPLSEAVGAMAGNPEWGDALDRYHPIVTVCGHDHQTPIGTGRWTWQPPWDGVVVNVGQAMTGPLRYCLLTFEFPSDTPCLPHRVKIEAFPLGATVEWPPQKHQE
jgi:Icc-related predicted phosphoesterase